MVPVAICKLFAFLGVVLALASLQMLVIALPPLKRHRRLLPRLFHRACLAVFAIEVRTTGEPAISGAENTPVLYVANHLSYLDIIVLGALIDGRFVAKADVAQWPVFGFLARLQDTLFIARDRKDLAAQRAALGAALDGGDSLILFPEGTSSDGLRVLPFKSALFSIVMPGAAATNGAQVAARQLKVQPVSIAATGLNGLPMGRNSRDRYAWFGDMELPPHLWALAKTRSVSVQVGFHPPISADPGTSRKALALEAEAAIRAGVDRMARGLTPLETTLGTDTPSAGETAEEEPPKAEGLRPVGKRPVAA